MEPQVTSGWQATIGQSHVGLTPSPGNPGEGGGLAEHLK
jgi:hypothetical protein